MLAAGYKMNIKPETCRRFHELRFLNAARGGGTESQRLVFSQVQATGLPEGLDALVITSDLQGVAQLWTHGGQNVLLGIAVADELARLGDAGTIAVPERTGVILAGDLYSAPGGDKRGATGDVREVWTAFAEAFRWVVGVAGNHDVFGTEKERSRIESLANVDILDGSRTEHDGITLGGVSYVVGNPEKVGRCEESEFFAALDLVLEEAPDVVILHEGPNGDARQPGNVGVRRAIEAAGAGLVVCGHSHWDEAFARVGQTQVINVDARVVVLTR